MVSRVSSEQLYYSLCALMGCPITLGDNGKSRVFRTTVLNMVHSIVLLLMLILPFFVGLSGLEEQMSGSPFAENAFHQSMGWVEYHYNSYMAALLLFVMVIGQRRMLDILNYGQEIKECFAKFHANIKLQPVPHLPFITTLLTIKILNIILYASDMFSADTNIAKLLMALIQIKFPLLFITLANSLLLDQVLLTGVLVQKLQKVLQEAVRAPLKPHKHHHMCDVFEDTARHFAMVHRFKATTFRGPISFAVILLALARFIDMLIRMFYIYSIVNDRSSAALNYKLVACHSVDLLTSILELVFLSHACEGLLSETAKIVGVTVKSCAEYAHSGQPRESALMFAIQLMDQKMSYNICGIFYLSNQFTAELVISAVFYVVLLIQFQSI